MAKATKLLTSKHLQSLFAVSHMAIQHWRKGSANREALPTEHDGRSVGFLPSKVKAWAKKHDVSFNAPTWDANVAACLLGSEPTAAPTGAKKDARTGKALAPLKPIKAAKPVAKKAATATHQKPAKKVSPLKSTKVATEAPAKKVTVKSGKSIPALRKEAEGTKAPELMARAIRRTTTTEAQPAA